VVFDRGVSPLDSLLKNLRSCRRNAGDVAVAINSKDAGLEEELVDPPYRPLAAPMLAAESMVDSETEEEEVGAGAVGSDEEEAENGDPWKGRKDVPDGDGETGDGRAMSMGKKC
jgi:hypothetical protein